MNEKNEINEIITEFELNEGTIIFDHENNDIYYTQESLSILYGTGKSNINQAISRVYKSGELFPHETEVDLNLLIKSELIQNDEKKNNRGRPSIFYNHKMFNALGFRIRSETAIQFRIKVNKLLESIRKGDLKLIDTKDLFFSIASKPTTPYRKKMSQKQLNAGHTEHYVEVRNYNVKLNTTVRELISKHKLAGHIPEVQIELGKIAYDMTPSEFRQVKGITNPHITRDFCTHEQNRIIQFLEEELYKMLFDHKGTLTKRHLFKYVEDCSERGAIYSKLLKDRISLHTSPIAATRQKSLEEFL